MTAEKNVRTNCKINVLREWVARHNGVVLSLRRVNTLKLRLCTYISMRVAAFVWVCVRTISQVFIVSGSTRGLIRSYALRVLVFLRLSSEVKPNNLANE